MSDEELYTQLTSNTEKGRQAVYQHFIHRIYQTSLRIVNSTEDAEEICQDVFLELFTQFDTFRRDASLSTLLFRITTNKALDKLRYKKRKKRFANLVSLVKGNSIRPIPDNTEASNPHGLVEKEELKKFLYEALEKLSEKQRICYTLYEMDGQSYQEIAAIMETSISAVESHLFKARKKLQYNLSEVYQLLTEKKQVPYTN